MYKYVQRINMIMETQILEGNLNKLCSFLAMEYSIPYFFLSILNIVVQLQVPVLMLYTIITKLGDYYI